MRVGKRGSVKGRLRSVALGRISNGLLIEATTSQLFLIPFSPCNDDFGTPKFPDDFEVIGEKVLINNEGGRVVANNCCSCDTSALYDPEAWPIHFLRVF